jgi:multiple sugar transport system permease protein
MNFTRPPRLAHLLLVAVAVLFSFPVMWMVLSSLKSGMELSTSPFSFWPKTWRFENYSDAMTAMPYARYLTNTLLLCLGTVCGTVVSSAVVAYGLARIQWPGRSICFALIIGTMLLPWHVTMIPRFLLLRELGLYDSLAAIVLPTFLGDAFFIFLLRQFFLTIPEELSEAARLDGLSEVGIFWRIILPLSRPALATVALFQLIATWNDFGGPLLFLSDPQKFPLAYGLERFVSAYSDQTHLLLAAATLFTLPIVIVFFLTQKLFVKGIATTGLKG